MSTTVASPSVASSIAGAGVDWLNPNNTFASNNLRATAALATATPASDALRVTGFDFTAIPANVSVDGVTISIEAKHTGISSMFIDSAQLVSGGAAIGTLDDTDNQTTSGDVTYTYGGAASKWGLSLNRADIADSTFGVQIIGGWNSGTGESIAVDHITITIHWRMVVPAKYSTGMTVAI